MRRLPVFLPLLCCLLFAACAGPPRADQEAAAQARIAAEVPHLRAALAAEVPRHTACGQEAYPAWIVPVQAALRAAGVGIDRPQLIVAVDRNPRHQRMCLLLARPNASWPASWDVIGGDQVSTGQDGRHGYFITPTGVFPHTAAILDWRAEGTFNENGIRGLGLRGMRVWDFGWQAARKGWPADEETGEIRLLLHATDPDVLEARLGRPASKGCIRISAAMNLFLDRHGILDADYEREAGTDARIRDLLLPDRQPTPLAGDTLVVIDSAGVR